MWRWAHRRLERTQGFVDRGLCSVRLFYTWFPCRDPPYLGLLLASRGLEFLHLFSSWTFIFVIVHTVYPLIHNLLLAIQISIYVFSPCNLSLQHRLLPSSDPDDGHPDPSDPTRPRPVPATGVPTSPRSGMGNLICSVLRVVWYLRGHPILLYSF